MKATVNGIYWATLGKRLFPEFCSFIPGFRFLQNSKPCLSWSLPTKASAGGPSCPLFHTVIPEWTNPLAHARGPPARHLAVRVAGTKPWSQLLHGVGDWRRHGPSSHFPVTRCNLITLYTDNAPIKTQTLCGPGRRYQEEQMMCTLTI